MQRNHELINLSGSCWILSIPLISFNAYRYCVPHKLIRSEKIGELRRLEKISTLIFDAFMNETASVARLSNFQTLFVRNKTILQSLKIVHSQLQKHVSRSVKLAKPSH